MPKTTSDGRIVWRMPEPCDDCPFGESDAGRFLNQTLRPGRLKSIERDLKRGAYFLCHKTTQADGWKDEDGTEGYQVVGAELVCAGSINWQAARGIVSDLAQCMERLQLMRDKGKHNGDSAEVAAGKNQRGRTR